MEVELLARIRMTEALQYRQATASSSRLFSRHWKNDSAKEHGLGDCRCGTAVVSSSPSPDPRPSLPLCRCVLHSLTRLFITLARR